MVMPDDDVRHLIIDLVSVYDVGCEAIGRLA
jgi:hypothetical protein